MLTKKLIETHDRRLEQLAAGGATFDQYKHDTGYLAGIKEAMALIKEVHKKLFGEDE